MILTSCAVSVPVLAFLVVIAIAAPWLVAVTIVTDGAFLAEAIGWSMLRKVSEAAENHTGPLGFHLMLSPVTLWPGAVLIALAVLAAWKNRSDGTILFSGVMDRADPPPPPPPPPGSYLN